MMTVVSGRRLARVSVTTAICPLQPMNKGIKLTKLTTNHVNWSKALDTSFCLSALD